jgi:hypothetical protein
MMNAEIDAIRALLASHEFVERLGIVFRRRGTVPEPEAYSEAVRFLAERKVTFAGIDLRFRWRPEARRVDVDVRRAKAAPPAPPGVLKLVPLGSTLTIGGIPC